MRCKVAVADSVHEQRLERKGHNPRSLEQTGGLMTERELFNSKRWQRLRASVLRRDNYLDQVAKRYGKRMTADTVHHIFPREWFPEYTFEPWNLISLSTSTHNKLHDRDGHHLTADGLKLLERTARQKNIKISDEQRKTLETPPGPST